MNNMKRGNEYSAEGVMQSRAGDILGNKVVFRWPHGKRPWRTATIIGIERKTAYVETRDGSTGYVPWHQVYQRL